MRTRSLARLFGSRFRSLEEERRWPSLPEDLRLEGDAILLRWPRLTDAESVFAYASDEAVNRFMDWPPHQGIEESRRFLYALEQSRTARREIAFGIIDREQNRLIGICSLVSQTLLESAEMGYALRRSAWGQGVMTEAVSMICPWAFHHLPLEEIFAQVHPENRGSQRVLEKAGFERQPMTVTRTIKGIRTPHYHYRMCPPTCEGASAIL